MMLLNRSTNNSRNFDMDAPDKIYLEKSLSFQDKFHSHWYKEDIVGNGVEYIRKDTLMQWLEGKKKHYMDRQEYDCGWNDLLDDIIDKINSL